MCRHFADGLLRLAGRVAFCRIHIDCYGTIEVEAVCHFGTKHILQGNKLADGCHFRAVAHEHVVQGMFVQAVFGRSLHHDAVHLAELVVVGYIRTAAIGAQGIQHIGDGNACPLALGGIHVNSYLRIVH